MKINIKGTIVSDREKKVYQWCGIPATSPSDVNSAIEKARYNEELELIINSGGGSVFDGSEIYTALKSYPGNVVVKIVGVAASAASVIAMAGNEIQMSPTAQMMIHNASTNTEGDHRIFGDKAEFLKRTDGTIANAYVAKTGKPKDEIIDLMGKTTWMDAAEAKENKFIDEIMFEKEVKAAASIKNNGKLLPKEVIDKVLNQIATGNKETGNPQKSGSGIEMEPKNTAKQEDEMTKDELKASNPDLYNEIYNDGASNERARIQELDNIKAQGAEELVAKAKYETFETKAEVAIKIVDGIGVTPSSTTTTPPDNGEVQRIVNRGGDAQILAKKLEDAKGSGIEEIEANLDETKAEEKKVKSMTIAEKIANKMNKSRGRE